MHLNEGSACGLDQSHILDPALRADLVQMLQVACTLDQQHVLFAVCVPAQAPCTTEHMLALTPCTAGYIWGQSKMHTLACVLNLGEIQTGLKNWPPARDPVKEADPAWAPHAVYIPGHPQTLHGTSANSSLMRHAAHKANLGHVLHVTPVPDKPCILDVAQVTSLRA